MVGSQGANWTLLKHDCGRPERLEVDGQKDSKWIVQKT